VRTRLEAKHLDVMEQLLHVRCTRQEHQRERGFDRQREVRELECRVRGRVVTFGQRLARRGRSLRWLAWRLGFAHSTLVEWKSRWHEDRLQARPRGRPASLLSPVEREVVVELLNLLGPSVGVPSLRVIFPKVARAELEYLLRRFRKTFRDENRMVVHVLRWERPGAVWAMDFHEPPSPVDGFFTTILSVRDLGSGKDLEWLPLAGATGRNVCDVLKVLFHRHGAPLVIKIDNAKAFRIEELRELLDEHGVWYLRSPPYSPWYNGTCETGIGTLKTYVHYLASRNDRPEYWTCDDVHGGLVLANALRRPHGPDGPTVDELWETRRPITDDERATLRQLIGEHSRRLKEGDTQEPECDNIPSDPARIERWAISWALSKAGYLSIRRRRIRPPKRWKNWSRLR
jgi:hypothetical protein